MTDVADLEPYRRDETAYLRGGLPVGVAFPASTDDVAELVRLCGEHDVPLVPRGAGTGLSGGAAGIEGALTISFMRMDRILEIDPGNLTVTTQPGVINATLKAAVAEHGLFYAPDPASYEMCSIGGNLGTNAGGLCCVKYGVTRDAVLGLEVVMADAQVIRLGGKNVKDVAGYGLIPLLVGSQGTLGLMTEATLRLLPAPARAVDDARLLPDARGRGRGRGRPDRGRDPARDPRAPRPDDDPGGRRRVRAGPRPGRRRDAARRVRRGRRRRGGRARPPRRRSARGSGRRS